MVLQSTQSVQDILLQAQAKATAQTQTAAPGQSPFKDLLDGALQATTEQPKAKETAQEPKEQPAEEGVQSHQPAEAQPKETDQTGEAQKPQKPAGEDKELEAAAAAVIAPVILPAAQPQQPAAQAGGEALPQAPAAEPQAAIPQQQVILQAQTPVAQPQPTTENEAAVQAAEQQPQPQVEAPPQAEIISAELEITNQQQPEEEQEIQLDRPAQEQPAETQAKPADQAQERFDGLVAKASQELQAAKTQTGGPQETRQPQAEETEQVKAEPKPQAKPVIQERPQKAVEGSKAEFVDVIKAEQPQPQIREAQPTEAPKAAHQATPAQQVEAQVIENLETEQMEFRMQLAPKELGRIDVKMILEGGKLTVQIAAASTKAVEELQRTSESLAASLRTAGAQLESVQIVHQPQESSEHMHGAFNMESGQSQAGEDGKGGSSARGQNPAQSGGEEEAAAGEIPSRLLDQAV